MTVYETVYEINTPRIIWRVVPKMRVEERRELRTHQAQVSILIDVAQNVMDFYKRKIITTRAVALISAVLSLNAQLREYNEEIEASLRYRPRKKKATLKRKKSKGKK